jgi:Zn-finger nucleic acid-binding protein
MICPRCNTNLAISNTQGIEIDYCPNCRGVWLDRGELEKIIERSSPYGSPYMDSNEHHNYNDHHHDKHYNYDHQSKHKKGLLSDFFDF